MQTFYINQNSTLNPLRIELVNNNTISEPQREAFNNALQNATVTFSMRDDNDKLKISHATCSILSSKDANCVEKFIIEYQWEKRDTKDKGTFYGRFNIHFNNEISQEGVEFPTGDLIVPIEEELIIMVK